MYPLAYNKWIREQVAENLGLPELYARLPHLFELVPFENSVAFVAGDAVRAVGHLGRGTQSGGPPSR